MLPLIIAVALNSLVGSLLSSAYSIFVYLLVKISSGYCPESSRLFSTVLYIVIGNLSDILYILMKDADANTLINVLAWILFTILMVAEQFFMSSFTPLNKNSMLIAICALMGITIFKTMSAPLSDIDIQMLCCAWVGVSFAIGGKTDPVLNLIAKLKMYLHS